MKKISLALALIGIFTLLFILDYSNPIKINLKTNISQLETNQKILLQGEVTSQSSSTLTINKNIRTHSNPSPRSYLHQNITLLGIIKEYKNKKSISILKIQIR